MQLRPGLPPEMPSFLPDDPSAAVYNRSPSGVVHLDPASEYGLSQEKVNGHIARQPLSHTSNESLDERSTNSTGSTHTLEPPDGRSQVDGASSSAMSSSPLPNGSAGGGDKDGDKKPLVNGILTTLADRTRTNSVVKVGGDDSPAPSPRDTVQRTSVGTERADDSVQPSPVEVYLQPIAKGDIRTVENGTTAATIPPPPPPTVEPPNPPETGQKKAPHRFSSPPVYGPSPNSSGALQSPPAPGIKHRHTLEVPKHAPAPGRGSRDGIDSYASGRFSPTIGGRRASLSLVRRNTRSLQSDAPRDDIVPDEDAMRWAEAYRQKRATKKRRREIEDDDRVLVGTKVDESHANWVTAYNMLTGIRVSVSRTNAKNDRELTDLDFEAKQKSTFDITGNELVPSAKYDFKFKDYAPWVFRHLRALFRLDPADYLMSLTGKYILSELGSPGKSGSFFYFSRDYKYIIKTIHHGEHKFLRKILKDYYRHVTENPNTLLSQFYGLHRVKMPYGKKIHFVVMNNLFPPHRDIHQTFDLKGSTHGRELKEEDLEANPRATLKDKNWLRRKRHLELGLQKKKLFLDQLKKDVILLQRLQIMDYSLLIGIHDLRRGNEENLRDKTLRVFNPGGDASQEDNDLHSVLMRTPSKLENERKKRELRQMIQSEKPVPMQQTSSRMPDELEEGHSRPGFIFNEDDGGFRATHEDNRPSDEIYYLGVIDCLTHYNLIKKMEYFWKGLTSDRNEISAQPPQEYGDRFLRFITSVTMSVEEAHRKAEEEDARMIAEAANQDSIRRRSSQAIPPVPNYQPPPPPTGQPPGPNSAQVEQTVRNAGSEVRKSEAQGAVEDGIPERTLRTTVTSPAPKQAHGSTAPVLPVVEEAAEGASTGDRSRNSRISSVTAESDGRPLTPAKDGDEMAAGFGNPLLTTRGHNGTRPPPTPPKTGHGYSSHLKAESADSGYGVGLRSVGGSQKSLGKAKLSRDSLDKALPPLPRVEGDGVV